MLSARNPAASRAAVLIAHRLRRWRVDRGHVDRGGAAVEVLRRMLEEAGIHCEESERLDGLAAFVISSPRGTEMVLSSALKDEERLWIYAHLLAHVLIGGQRGQLLARFEYAEGREPSHLSVDERREEMVARSLTRVILDGRLEGAPRYFYDEIALPTVHSGVRRIAAQTILAALHVASMALYWRLPSYQQLRGLPAVAGLATLVQSFLGEGQPLAA